MPPLYNQVGQAVKDSLHKTLMGLVVGLGLVNVLDLPLDCEEISTVAELSMLGESTHWPVSITSEVAPRNQCPFDMPFSCSNESSLEMDLCCFEYPGGVILQTQFWDYSPATGPNDSFTLHGLWPDNCDGSFEQFCDSSMEISDPAGIIEGSDPSLLEDMHTYWKDNRGHDEYLWKHEFNKHGTCYSTLKPKCYGNNLSANQNVVDYFNQSVQLFKSLPTYEWLVEAGITPSETETYTKAQILDALTSKFGAEPYIRCDPRNAILEVWYFHHLKGPLIGGQFQPIDSLTASRCPREGISFPPKVPHLVPTGTHTAPIPRPTDPSESKGYIKLTNQGGCLIRNGHWYMSGACAGYTMVQLPTGSVHLKSSGGYCTIWEGGFTCSNTASPFEFEFDPDTKIISANGQTTFSADALPRGKVQQRIRLGEGNVEFNLKFVSMYN